MKKFMCEKCGEIDHVEMDGYSFGDTLLEGVIFEVRPDLSVTIAKSSEEYLKSLNAKKWLKAARDHAKENDVAICPKCNSDVDAQPKDEP